MKKFFNPPIKEWNNLLSRPEKKFREIKTLVEEIFEKVRQEGDKEVKYYAQKYDGVLIDSLLVNTQELKEAQEKVDETLKGAIQLAKNNIEKFHQSQIHQPQQVETMPGVVCWQEKRPIEKVGLYIPGGTASLFSTVLMLAIPAKLAKCQEVILCSPPDQKGKIHPAILYAANLCGVEKNYKVGGIQAIAALTFGTETIPKVDKIFGPGNQYVTTAKQVATKYKTAIDMPAGPSELLVIADHTANATFVASDLLSQAEHGADSQVIMITTSKALLQAVEKEVALQMEQLSRKEIAQKSIENSKLIWVEDKETAIKMSNQYAPEHLIIATEDNGFFIENVTNAGSVFIGNYTPESAGDYASGTNHTLPTNGHAKSYSGVALDTFMKTVTFQQISKKGLQNIGNAIEIMAEAEALTAHKNAVTIRLKK